MQQTNIVIATGYEALFAYMLMPSGNPQLIKRIEFCCDRPTDSPLVRWENKRLCYAELTEMIDLILNRYRCDAWGLACRSEQIAPLLATLVKSPHYPSLAAVMETDCDAINLSNVRARFIASAGDLTSAKRFGTSSERSIA